MCLLLFWLCVVTCVAVLLLVCVCSFVVIALLVVSLFVFGVCDVMMLCNVCLCLYSVS